MQQPEILHWIERRLRGVTNSSRGSRPASAAQAGGRSKEPRLIALCAAGTLCLLGWVVATARAERVGDAMRLWWSTSVVGHTGSSSSVLSVRYPPLSYAGRDARGVPHYSARPFSRSERLLLSSTFGIERPEHLYLSDSTSEAVLLYDPTADCGDDCLVMTYRVGAPSIRRPGESWDAMERRVLATPTRAFSRRLRVPTRSLDALSPTARPAFDSLLTAARAAGFEVRVTESYRSPERQAYLLARGMTRTGTSLHSDGRAIDVLVGDGRLANPRTRARWIAFRSWVLRYQSGRFRLLGSVDSSWDWPHIELPNQDIGFQSIEELLDSAAARAASR